MKQILAVLRVVKINFLLQQQTTLWSQDINNTPEIIFNVRYYNIDELQTSKELRSRISISLFHLSIFLKNTNDFEDLFSEQGLILH